MNFVAFFARIDLDRLRAENRAEAVRRGKAPRRSDRCMMCRGSLSEKTWLRLNDGAFVCSECLSGLQRVRYPEIYQARYERHLENLQAHKSSRAKREDWLKRRWKLDEWTRAASFFAGVWVLPFVGGGVVTCGLDTESRASVWTGIVVLSLLCLAARMYCVGRIRIGQEHIARVMSSWDSENPQPVAPELKDFGDSDAVLTEYDRAVVRLLDYWPGYPPSWSHLREAVFARDGQRCQITGCPSRLALHAHHKRPIGQGGSHQQSNLVTLCAYHHAMQEEVGHERIRGSVTTPFFAFVRPYMRSDGVRVRGHLRHKTLIEQEELDRLLFEFGIVCRRCSKRVNASIETYKVRVRCPRCGDVGDTRRSIAEEVGPAVCSMARATQNVGSWSKGASYLENRAK